MQFSNDLFNLIMHRLNCRLSYQRFVYYTLLIYQKQIKFNDKLYLLLKSFID